ncbi:MAG TPA: anti-sigma factor [Gemmatimonadaceae bacterium]
MTPPPTAPGAAPPARRFLGVRLIAAAAIAAVGATVAYRMVAERQRADALEHRVSALVAARHDLERQLDSARSTLAERDALLAGITGAGVRVIDAARPGARAPSARVFWNQPTGTWTLIAHDLPPAPAGEVYQLWLGTRDGGRVSAGTFAPRPDGDAVLVARHPLASDALARIAVTREPAGGSARPTSPPVLVGAASTK